MSDELNLLISETQGIAICITNEDQATQNDISQWVDDIVENLETIRKALTRPAIDCADMVRLQSIEEGLYSAYETGNPMMLWDYVEKLMEGGE